jgi:hypothetical protein
MATIVNMPQNVRTMTLTLAGETRINFANDYNSIAIRAENDCGIAEFAGKQIGDNGVLKCNAGESVIYPNLISKRYIYLIGVGKVELLVGNNLPVNPFKNGAKGGGRIENPLNYLGVTTTTITNGSTTNPIIIDSEEVTAENADWVIYNSKDFIFNGTVWQEVGDFENYYTKTQTDALLSAKANAADVYTKAQSDDRYVQNANVIDTVTAQEIADSLDNIWEMN